MTATTQPAIATCRRWRDDCASAPKNGCSTSIWNMRGQTGSVRATTSAADTIDLDQDANMLHLEVGYSLRRAVVAARCAAVRSRLGR